MTVFRQLIFSEACCRFTLQKSFRLLTKLLCISSAVQLLKTQLIAHKKQIMFILCHNVCTTEVLRQWLVEARVIFFGVDQKILDKEQRKENNPVPSHLLTFYHRKQKVVFKTLPSCSSQQYRASKLSCSVELGSTWYRNGRVPGRKRISKLNRLHRSNLLLYVKYPS